MERRPSIRGSLQGRRCRARDGRTRGIRAVRRSGLAWATSRSVRCGVTEGWPAASRSPRACGADRDPADPSELQGDHHLVVRYVREEVLAAQRPEMVGFLLATSVLDRFSAETCDSLRGAHDSGPLLRALAAENLLIVSLTCVTTGFATTCFFATRACGACASLAGPDARTRAPASRLAVERSDRDEAIRHALRGRPHRCGRTDLASGAVLIAGGRLGRCSLGGALHRPRTARGRPSRVATLHRRREAQRPGGRSVKIAELASQEARSRTATRSVRCFDLSVR